MELDNWFEIYCKLLNLQWRKTILNGKLYDQIDGVAMASPLGPSMAKMFMCALEQRYSNDCPSEFKTVLYRRYFDDTYCFSRHREHVEQIIEHINKFHPNIKFTIEIKTHRSLPFLDMLVTNEQNIFLQVSVARKRLRGFTLISPALPQKTIRCIGFVFWYFGPSFHISSTHTMNFHNELILIKKGPSSTVWSNPF